VGLGKEKRTVEELQESLLAKDHIDLILFNVAANRPEKEVFQKLLKYAIDNLTLKDIQIPFTFK